MPPVVLENFPCLAYAHTFLLALNYKNFTFKEKDMKIILINKIVASILLVIFTFTSCHVAGTPNREPVTPPYYNPVPGDVKFVFLDKSYKETDTDVGILAMVVENNEYTKDIMLIAEIRDNDVSNNAVRVRVLNTENNSLASFHYDRGMSFPDSMIINTGEEDIEGSFDFYDSSTETYSVTFFDNNTGESETIQDILLNKNMFSLYAVNASWTETQNLRLQTMCTTLAVWISLSAALDTVDDGDSLMARSLKSFWQKIKKTVAYIFAIGGAITMVIGAVLGSPIVIGLGALAFDLGQALFRELPEDLITTKRFDFDYRGRTFTMGSNDPEDVGAQPAHQVKLTSSFRVGKYPVTQEQYVKVMGINPSYFTTGAATGEKQEKRPVEMVTWYDAVEFCNKASRIAALTPVYTISARTPASGYPITSATVSVDWNADGFRLPTEAEWELACRSGTTTAYSFGDDVSKLDNYAWYGISYNDGGKTHQVGMKKENPSGLCDMYGNVKEWCWDWYGTYSSATATNPKGPSTGTYRVARGGSWVHAAQSLRSAYRYTSSDYVPSYRSRSDGFRVVRLGP
jgi:formylglycine-generating enzyme